MSEKKSTTNRTAEINDSMRDNTLRVVDEITKVQPQVAQSVSNLQHDTIEASSALKTSRWYIPVALTKLSVISFDGLVICSETCDGTETFKPEAICF